MKNHHEKNQTHLYVNPETVADQSTLEYGADTESVYLKQASDLLEATQQEYKDLDTLERVQFSRELKSDTEELKDLLKGPESDLKDWIKREPIVVGSIAFATRLREGAKGPVSAKEREVMQAQMEHILGDMYKRAGELEASLERGDLTQKREGEINRSLAHLKKASYVITFEAARKKELGLW